MLPEGFFHVGWPEARALYHGTMHASFIRGMTTVGLFLFEPINAAKSQLSILSMGATIGLENACIKVKISCIC